MMCVPLHSFLQHASRPNSTLSNSLKSTRVRVFTPLKLENATNQMLFLFLSNHHVIENWVSRMREREWENCPKEGKVCHGRRDQERALLRSKSGGLAVKETRQVQSISGDRARHCHSSAHKGSTVTTSSLQAF